MAKYKCIVSGNVIEFTNQVDIDSMVGHEGYIKLEEQEVAKEAVKTPTKKTKQVAEVAE
jgi:hypothetical protein